MYENIYRRSRADRGERNTNGKEKADKFRDGDGDGDKRVEVNEGRVCCDVVFGLDKRASGQKRRQISGLCRYKFRSKEQRSSDAF